MNKYSRPCLTCRMLFIPSQDSPSHCAKHKPTQKGRVRKKKYNYPKGRRPYDDAEYRRNRKILRETQRYCSWCQTRGSSNNKLQVDHIVPLVKGGGHEMSNLRILCSKCHQLRKGVAHR